MLQKKQKTFYEQQQLSFATKQKWSPIKYNLNENVFFYLSDHKNKYKDVKIYIHIWYYDNDDWKLFNKNFKFMIFLAIFLTSLNHKQYISKIKINYRPSEVNKKSIKKSAVLTSVTWLP